MAQFVVPRSIPMLNLGLGIFGVWRLAFGVWRFTAKRLQDAALGQARRYDKP